MVVAIGCQKLTDVKSKENQGALMSRQEALDVAQRSDAVDAFTQLLLKAGQVDCMEKEVLRSCDTDWVSCVEDVWVVQFKTKPTCFPGHDERLGVVLLVDARDGHIRSVFPEADYFKSPEYCHDYYDCFIGKEQGCTNFVFNQLWGGNQKELSDCQCKANQCVMGL